MPYRVFEHFWAVAFAENEFIWKFIPSPSHLSSPPAPGFVARLCRNQIAKCETEMKENFFVFYTFNS